MARALRFIFLFLFSLQLSFYAQNKKIDSLRAVLIGMKTCPATCVEDTARVKILIQLAKQFLRVAEFDSAEAVTTRARIIAEKIDYKRGQSDSYNITGEMFRMQGDYSKAMKNYMASLRIAMASKDDRALGICFNNMGLVYDHDGNYPEALNCFFTSLKIKDRMADRSGQASTYTNLGNLYYRRSNYQDALNYFSKALEIFKENKDSYGISAAYSNMANAYMDKGELDRALQNYLYAIEIKKKINDRKGIANLNNNLGNIYFYRKQYPQALESYFLHIKGKLAIGDSGGIGSAYTNIGRTYMAQSDLKSAKLYLENGLKILFTEQEKGDIEAAYASLSELYEKQKDHRKAFEAYKQYILYRDSLYNEENTKKTVQLEMNYEFSKKQEQARLEAAKKDALAASDKKRQNIILFSVAGFGVLVLGFAVFAWRSFLQKKRTNEEISRQKHLIEEKQKEILDSIYYARRIQRSLLTSEKYISRNLDRRV